MQRVASVVLEHPSYILVNVVLFAPKRMEEIVWKEVLRTPVLECWKKVPDSVHEKEKYPS